jgi:hypothetical protein
MREDYKKLEEVPREVVNYFLSVYECSYTEIDIDIEWQDLYVLKEPMKGCPIQGLVQHLEWEKENAK